MAIADKRVLNCPAIFIPEYMANTKTTGPISQYTTGIATSELQTPGIRPWGSNNINTNAKISDTEYANIVLSSPI